MKIADMSRKRSKDYSREFPTIRLYVISDLASERDRLGGVATPKTPSRSALGKVNGSECYGGRVCVIYFYYLLRYVL